MLRFKLNGSTLFNKNLRIRFGLFNAIVGVITGCYIPVTTIAFPGMIGNLLPCCFAQHLIFFEPKLNDIHKAAETNL